MRYRFEQQTVLGITPISDVVFPLRSRDELPPVLKGLQHIFMTPSLNEKIFSLLETRFTKGKKKTGRRGMDLWHVLVLGVVRHSLNTNWDRLEHIANNDKLVRKVLGIYTETGGMEETEFSYQSIIDNVSLLDETILFSINQLVVDAGHALLKKNDTRTFTLKTDSYTLETNVHFPTDLNLLWDSLRKCMDTVRHIKSISNLKGWRKLGAIQSKTKSIFRQCSQQVFSSNGKNEKQKRLAVQAYLSQSLHLQQRFKEVAVAPISTSNELLLLVLQQQLTRYTNYVQLFSNQIERRLLQGEKIPADEKVFSIFEEHTEWIQKGKMNKKVELGHLLLITTDQHQLIVDYKIMEGEKDAAQVPSLKERIKKNYPGYEILSHSFDKGFYSKENVAVLEDDYTKQAIMPKKGKLNQLEKEKEHSKSFKELRKDHSAVESNINMLEHHGLARCVDKGMKGYKRNVGLSVMAYNLHIIGNEIIRRERILEEKKKAQRERYYRNKLAA